jgi:uncharacterized protein (DUF736 family)
MNGTREKDPSEIGSLWSRTSQKGDEYLTGEIDGQRVVCFRNRTSNPKAPAWRVLKSQPREQPRPSRVDRADAPTDDEIGF